MAKNPRLGCLSRGFTLVELTSTLTITGILASLAIPSLNSILSNQNLTTEVNAYVAHVHLARSESIKRGLPVVMCPSTNLTHCTGGFQWNRGFILFTDKGKDRQVSSGDELIRVVNPSNGDIQILSSKGRQKLNFHPTGMSPGSNATVRFCPPNAVVPSKAVIISNSGRPRVSKKMPDSKPISC